MTNRKLTYPHLDLAAINAARRDVSPELAAAIARQSRRVTEYVESLGGYGARITIIPGARQRIVRTGTLAPAATSDQWPHIVTEDGRHYRVCPPDAPVESVGQ